MNSIALCNFLKTLWRLENCKIKKISSNPIVIFSLSFLYPDHSWHSSGHQSLNHQYVYLSVNFISFHLPSCLPPPIHLSHFCQNDLIQMKMWSYYCPTQILLMTAYSLRSKIFMWHAKPSWYSRCLPFLFYSCYCPFLKSRNNELVGRFQNRLCYVFAIWVASPPETLSIFRSYLRVFFL